MEFTTNFLTISIFGVIALFSCAHVARSVGHDVNVGFCTNVIWNRSVPMMTKVVHKQNNRMFKMFRKTNLTIRFPEFGEFDKPIKCIMMKDNARDGTGAFATVQSGGVNYRHVVIYFRTQRGGDINFDVGIYGDGSRPAVQPPYTNSYPPIGWNQPPQQQPPSPQYGWNYLQNQNQYPYGHGR